MKDRLLYVTIGLLVGIVAMQWTMPSGHAGPDSAVNYLMDEPVSMLDWGNAQMEEALNRFPPASVELSEAHPISAFVDYSWQENRISVQLALFGSFEMVQQARTAILEVARSTRRLMRPSHDNEFLSKMYSHDGFSRSTEPSTLASDVANIIELHITAYTDETFISGTGLLVENDLSWDEKQ